MKRLFLGAGIILALATITFFGCQKDKDIKTSENNTLKNLKFDNISVIDNRIAFETRQDYENTIEYLNELGDENFSKWEKGLNFLSMRQKYENDNMFDEMPVEDELFATLLNPDGIIQIGENIFKIDVENEKVYSMLETDNCTEYDMNLDLLKSGGANNDIRVFSTEDNVLDIVEGTMVNELKRKKKYCRSKKTGWFYTNMSPGYKVEYKIHYLKLGIYYTLFAQIRQRNGSCGTVTLKIKSNSFWENKNGSNHDISGTYNGTTNVKRTVYSSSKRLKNYKMDVDFSHYCSIALPTSFSTNIVNSCWK